MLTNYIRPSRRSAIPACGFTLIELLVTIAIIAVLAGMLFPVLARARTQALVVTAVAEMRSIAMSLNLYRDSFDAYPPTVTFCAGANQNDYNTFYAGFADWLGGAVPPDVFNKDGRPYKYITPGPGYSNGLPTILSVWVNGNFPEPGGAVRPYHNLKTSPVQFALWSVGPGGPQPFTKATFYPVPPKYWYPDDPEGIISWIQTPSTHYTSMQ